MAARCACMPSSALRRAYLPCCVPWTLCYAASWKSCKTCTVKLPKNACNPSLNGLYILIGKLLCKGAAMAQKRKLRITPKFIVLLTVLCVVFACALYLSQEQKLKEIAEKEAALQQEYQALQNEEQRLEYMIEYAKSEEYLIQYAREKLGFVLPDDVKFDIED
ncbi:MAG: hypothetical protein DBX63_07340 [Clostridia bacterium]|nr:MAG: hypothetical protein DBX63_07340 [Clostridia bacterium]